MSSSPIDRIDQALSFIEENLESNLTLECIADEAHYSSFRFHRLFKSTVGESLNTYITRKRIEKCATILMHEEPTHITELAFRYGFNSNFNAHDEACNIDRVYTQN